MRRHALGTGAALTRAWLQAAVPVYVAGVILASSYDDERTVKRRSHYAATCPLCNGRWLGTPLDRAAGLRWEFSLASQNDPAGRRLPASYGWR